MTQPPPRFFEPERDVTAEQTADNLERLASALAELGAVRYTDREGALDQPAPDRFVEDVEQFASPVGYIDVLRWIPVAGDFHQLASRAETIDVGGVRVLVAALADVIASKEAADRDKDRAQLPALYALRDELNPPTS